MTRLQSLVVGQILKTECTAFAHTKFIEWIKKKIKSKDISFESFSHCRLDPLFGTSQ